MLIGRFYFPLLFRTVDNTEVSLKLDFFNFSFAISHVDTMYNCNSVWSAQRDQEVTYNKQLREQLGLINRTGIASTYPNKCFMTHESGRRTLLRRSGRLRLVLHNS
jgi:hypothetical protein